MTLEEAIAEIEKLTTERGKLSDKKPTVVFGQGKYLDEAVRILERHKMTDKIKQTIVKCLRALQDADDPDIYEVAKEMVEEFGYTVEELLKPEPPKWYENIPEKGVLCWYEEAVVLVTDYYPNPNGRSSVKIATHRITGDLYVYTAWVTPLTDAELESFKKQPNADKRKNEVEIANLKHQLESRENLIKKLVADNADLSQKRLELIADAQLLGEDK